MPITYSPTPININRPTSSSKKGTKMNSRIDVEIQIIKDELDELMEDPVLNRDRIKELKGDLEILKLQLEAEQLWNKQNIFDHD